VHRKLFSFLLFFYVSFSVLVSCVYAETVISWTTYEEAVKFYDVPTKEYLSKAMELITEHTNLECGVQDENVDVVAELERRKKNDEMRLQRIDRVKKDKRLADAVGYLILKPIPKATGVFEISSAIDLILSSEVSNSKELVLVAYLNADKISVELMPGIYVYPNLENARKSFEADLKNKIYERVADVNDPFFEVILQQRP